MQTINILLKKATLKCPISIINFFNKRFLSSLEVDYQRQNELFNQEKKRQRELIGRIEKIDVNYYGYPEPVVLSMNKNISTPHDVAKHIREKLANNSAVAFINDETYWHMHKPLLDSCKLEFRHYLVSQPTQINKIFWRTCSFLLGGVIRNAFKDNINVKLHSFPVPNVRSGSFVYDVQLSLDNWQPTQKELKVLSMEMIKFCQQSYPIEYLDVTIELAQDIFKDNSHKYNQIPDIALHNNGKVTLFRAGQHIDISKGPMVANTNHIGRVTVANVIKLNTDIPDGPIYRFQGVALPHSVILNHFAFGLLEERARELNSARIPTIQETNYDDHNFAAAQISQ